MSARALNWAWEQVPSNRPAKLVLVALADRADEEGVCWPSRRWLAQKCAPMSIDAVQRALAQLADDRLIVKEERLRRDDGTLGPWRIRLPVGQMAETPSGRKPPVDPVGENDHAEPKDPSLTSDEVSAQASGRKRDLVFDALTERFGDAPQGTARGAWNTAVRSLKADGWDGVDPPLSAIEQAYRKLYGDVALTPTALAKHYTLAKNELRGKERARAAACPECGIGGGLHVADCPKAAVAA